MDTFVLKGGNALEIGYKMSSRASIDVDVSMTSDFEDYEKILKKLENIFKETYKENDYIIFDFKMAPKPRVLSEKLKDFWGGYQITYKIIEQEKYNDHNGVVIATGQKTTFTPNHPFQ